MVAIAAINRLVLTPRLVQTASAPEAGRALFQLRINTLLEVAIGVIIIAHRCNARHQPARSGGDHSRLSSFPLTQTCGRREFSRQPVGAKQTKDSWMRSLLFVPADSPQKLDKGMTSGADALIIDLEDSIALDGKAPARQSAAAFLKDTVSAASRPYLVVRVNSLETGLTDADLDAVIPAKPDAIMLPKAEGGAAVIHADAKLAVREALGDLPDGHVKIIALATETATALFLAGTYRGASTRLSALTWGAEDLSADLGAETNRDAQGRFLDPYRLARALCLAGAAAAEVPALDTVYVDFRDSDGLRRECEEARRDGFTAKWRSIRRRCRSSTRCSRRRRKPGARASNHRCVCRQSGRRRCRHRRRHVRSPASCAGEAAAGASQNKNQNLRVSPTGNR